MDRNVKALEFLHACLTALIVSNLHSRTNMSAMIFNCSSAVYKDIGHLDICDISDNSGSSVSRDSSDSRQENTYLPDFATICSSNRHCIVLRRPLFLWTNNMFGEVWDSLPVTCFYCFCNEKKRCFYQTLHFFTIVRY